MRSHRVVQQLHPSQLGDSFFRKLKTAAAHVPHTGKTCSAHFQSPSQHSLTHTFIFIFLATHTYPYPGQLFGTFGKSWLSQLSNSIFLQSLAPGACRQVNRCMPIWIKETKRPRRKLSPACNCQQKGWSGPERPEVSKRSRALPHKTRNSGEQIVDRTDNGARRCVMTLGWRASLFPQNGKECGGLSWHPQTLDC